MKKIFSTTLILIFALSNFCFAEMNIDISDKVRQHELGDGGFLQAWVDDATNRLYGKFPLLGGGNSTIFYLDRSSCNCTIKDGKAFVGAIVHNIAGGVNEDGTPEFYRVFVFKFESYIENGDRKIFLKDISIQSDNSSARGNRFSEEEIIQELLKYDDGLIFHIFQRAIGITGL